MKNSLVKNAFFNIIYNILNVIFPLISTAYISHVLHASGVGRVALAQNISQYFVLLAPLGLLNYGTKKIAEISDDKYQRDKVFSELYILNVISTLFFSVSYYILIYSLTYFDKNRDLLLITGLAIVFNLINVEWYYRGTEEFSYIAIRSFIVKVISLLMLMIFVRSEADYWKYALIYVLAIGGNYFFNIVKLFKSGVRLNLTKLSLKKHIKPAIILLLNTIAGEIYSLLDTTMLGYMCNEEIVAYYTNAVKLVKVCVSVVTALCGVLLPRLSYYKNRGFNDRCDLIINKTIRILIYIIIPSMVGLFVLAEPIIRMIYGDTFIPSAENLKVAVLLIMAMGFSYLFGSQVLITFNQEKLLFICSLIGTIANVVLNLVLIPLYYQDGAIVASIVCEYLVMIFTIVFSKKYVNFVFKLKDVIFSTIASLLMGIIVFFVSDAIVQYSLKIGLSVGVGVVTYCLIIFVINSDIKKDMKQYILNRKKNYNEK